MSRAGRFSRVAKPRVGFRSDADTLQAPASSPRLSEETEERLRPSRFLGYDRAHLGVALLRREMFEAAESQFRRVCYLNPYNAVFRHHLAWCLYKMGRLEEAAESVAEAIELDPRDPDARVVVEHIREKLAERNVSR